MNATQTFFLGLRDHNYPHNSDLQKYGVHFDFKRRTIKFPQCAHLI